MRDYDEIMRLNNQKYHDLAVNFFSEKDGIDREKRVILMEELENERKELLKEFMDE